MAGLVPAIHVFAASGKKGVDARHKAGHDGSMIDTVAISAEHFREAAIGLSKEMRSIEGTQTSMAAKRPPALDRIDVKILAALQRDSRSTIQKLAQAVGLSPRACLERVRRLEAAGVLAGYQAVIELGRLSRPVNIFAEIILERHANRGRFEKRLAALEEVVECWEVSGTVDYVARFVCADLAAYEALTSEMIGDAGLGVSRIISHVVLRP